MQSSLRSRRDRLVHVKIVVVTTALSHLCVNMNGLQSNFYEDDEDELECAIEPDDILRFDSGDESDDSIPIIAIETFTTPLL